MKSNRYYLLLVLSVFLTFSCSEDQIQMQDETTGTFAKPGNGKGNGPALTYSVNRANQYHLNVVFFKPTDYQVTSTLIDQTSDVMLYIQKWYEKQMELQGFGQKTFGLM
ncbi:hypothetical protein ACFLRU_06690, partial [Bacteroidota bacterium]